MSPVTIGSIRAGTVGPMGPAGTWNAVGCARPFRVTVATIRSGVGQYGPVRLETIQPVRSVSAHWPIGRSRSGVSEHAGPDPSTGPEMRLGLTSSRGSGSSMPIATIQRPSGDQAAWFAQPAGARTSRGSAPSSSTSIAQIVVRGRTSGSGPRADVNAILCPSGLQAMSDTPQSPEVTCRGLAPGFASTTNRCDQRSRWPTPSQRQSDRVIRRASGDSSRRDRGSLRPIGGTSPTRNRGGSTSAVKARRDPSGDHSTSPTDPKPIARTWRTRPPAIGTRHRRVGSPSSSVSPRRNATCRASGEIRGQPSRTAPLVIARGADDATRDAEVSSRPSRTTCRWLWYRSRRMMRFVTTATLPSAAMSCSSRTTCRRMSAGVIGDRALTSSA